MAFNKAVREETVGLGSGEVITSSPYNTETFSTFEDGTVQGRFVKYDAGSVDMLDGSATPKIIGVTRRKIGGELGVTTYTATTDTVCEVHTFGKTTVDVVTGDTPAKYGIAYAVNATGADSGKATTTATDNVNTGCVFWEQMSTNVWLVLIPNFLK